MRSLLVISIDTMRRDHFVPEIMPNLTARIDAGLYANQVVVGGSWTIPSHTCLFTGQGPWHHTFCGDPPDQLRAALRNRTLFGRLQDRGYETQWWGGNLLTACRQDDEVWGGPGEAGITADGRVDEILDWISTASKPWGVFLHYWGAHAPYGLDVTCPYLGASLRNPDNVAPVMAAYRERLTEIDSEVHRILQGAGEAPLVLITSDHGEDFGVGHLMQPAFTYLHMHCTGWRDRVIVVPALILNGPEGQITYQVRNYDLAPTVWELLFGQEFEGATGYPIWLEGRDRIAESWSTEWGVDICTVRLGSRRATHLLARNEAWLVSGEIDTWEELYPRAVGHRDEVITSKSDRPGVRWGEVERRLADLGYF